MNTKKSIQILLAFVLAITIVTGVRYVIAGALPFTAPTGTPPTNNTSEPINIGTTPQDKMGPLNLKSATVSSTIVGSSTTGLNVGLVGASYTNLLTSSGLTTNAFIANANALFKQNVGISSVAGFVPGADLEIKGGGTYTIPNGGGYTGGQLVIGNVDSTGTGPRLDLGYNTTADNAFIDVGNYFPSGEQGSRSLLLQPNGGLVQLGGKIKILGGTPGAGKVLTSDAAGLASWTTPTTGTTLPTCSNGQVLEVSGGVWSCGTNSTTKVTTANYSGCPNNTVQSSDLYYTKIGNMVFLSGEIVLHTSTTGTTSVCAELTNIPRFPSGYGLIGPATFGQSDGSYASGRLSPAYTSSKNIVYFTLTPSSNFIYNGVVVADFQYFYRTN